MRWHIDIPGTDRPADDDDELGMFQLRRAILMHTLLKRQPWWSEGKEPFHPCVERAFLNVTGFRHGVRSVEAILSMSHGVKGRHLQKMDLPPAQHLDMHVDAHEFLDLVNADQAHRLRRGAGK